MTAGMDRPAYELVRLLQALLDDCDQRADSADEPNGVTVWAVRHVLEDFGGKRHRWSFPRCQDCDHFPAFHHDGCDLCPCALTRREVTDGRDTELDDEIVQAARDDEPV